MRALARVLTSGHVHNIDKGYVLKTYILLALVMYTLHPALDAYLLQVTATRRGPKASERFVTKVRAPDKLARPSQLAGTATSLKVGCGCRLNQISVLNQY